MTQLFKLTRYDNTTYGGCQWGEGVEHTAPGGGRLCSSAFLHAYETPLQAAILSPLHCLWWERLPTLRQLRLDRDTWCRHDPSRST